MAGITLAQAEAELAKWILAGSATATQGQSYGIGGRQLQRASAADIQKLITYWEAHVQRLSGGGSVGRLRNVVPVP